MNPHSVETVERPVPARRSGPTPRALAAALAFAACAASSPTAVRAQSEVPVLRAPSPAVRVDGWLREWQTGAFATVGVDPAARLRVALSPTEAGLFVAASVDDDRLVRTGRSSAAEDAVVLTYAVERAGSLAAAELWLYAGVVNETPATLSVGGPDAARQAPRGARIVEMQTATGYDLEAFIPWSALPGAEWPVARVAARLSDVDSAGQAPRLVSNVPAGAAPSAFPRVVGTAGELFPLSSFLQARRARPADVEHELRANFSGGAALERVVVAGGTLAIVGADYANGRDFDYAELSVRGGVSEPRAVDYDGDGRAEFACIVARAEGPLTVRELRVFRFPGDRIEDLLRVEVGLSGPGFDARAPVRFETPRGGPPHVYVDASPVAPPARTGHVPASGAEPLLVASSGVVTRAYAWSGAGFATTDTQAPSAPASGQSAATAHPAHTAGQPGQPPTPVGARSPTPVATSPAPTTQAAAPTPARGGFDPRTLYASVLRDRSLPERTAPRFEASADVVDDARPETVAVLGRTVVLVGPGYRSGLGYFALDLDVPTDEDVVGLSLGDVTGDGKSELHVRVRQPVPPTQFALELLVIYRLDASGMAPIFTAQVALSDATRAVRNELRVVGSGRSLQLAIAPGRPTGFDARSFPFTSLATPGMATLLLPWRDAETRYRWNGTALVGN